MKRDSKFKAKTTGATGEPKVKKEERITTHTNCVSLWELEVTTLTDDNVSQSANVVSKRNSPIN